MNENQARFWQIVFGGVTAVGLIAGGVYSLVQYFDNQKKDRATQELQIATTKFTAQQQFNSKLLELCAEASSAAATAATSAEVNKRNAARDEFWRLYWGPLGIVEGTQVSTAMVAYGRCLSEGCTDLKHLALNVAHACREEISAGFEIKLPPILERPEAAGKAQQ